MSVKVTSWVWDLESLTAASDLNAPEILFGYVGDPCGGSDGAVFGVGAVEGLEGAVNGTKEGVQPGGGVADEDFKSLGVDDDLEAEWFTSPCLKNARDGVQFVLGEVGSEQPCHGKALGVDVGRVGAVGGCLLGTVWRLDGLANRLFRGCGVDGGLKFADRVDEGAGEVGQEGFDVVVGAQARQELVRALFEARGDGAVAHRSAPCAEEER